MRDSKIGWCHDTVNFWWGCAKVHGSPACDFCYAWSLDKIRGPLFDEGRTHWGKDSTRWLRVPKAIGEILSNEARAIRTGQRRRQFINSMSDFFEDRRDLDAARRQALATFMQCDHLDILLLTKRIDKVVDLLQRAYAEAIALGQMRLAHWLAKWLDGKPPANIWLGTTAENQEWLEKRLPQLATIPAAVHWISGEPLLGPMNLGQVEYDPRCMAVLDWLVIGCESHGFNVGRGADDYPHYANHAIRQCEEIGIKVFNKQMPLNGKVSSNPTDWPQEFRVQQFPESIEVNAARAAAAITKQFGPAMKVLTT